MQNDSLNVLLSHKLKDDNIAGKNGINKRLAYKTELNKKFEKFSILPTTWVEKFCTINIRTPFKFISKHFDDRGNEVVHDRSYLFPIYNNENKKMIMKTGRQCEKSTLISNKIMIQSCMHPESRQILFVAPRKDQMEKFSNQRIKPLYEINEKIAKFWYDPRLPNKVSEKMTTTGSTINLSYAYLDADRIRGLSIYDTFIDEIQDQLTDNIIIIEECSSHYLHIATFLYSGTPKSIDGTLEQYWNLSTQNEWEIYCHHCGQLQILDDYSVGPEFLWCKKCKKQVNKKWGHWVCTNPGSEWIGFRIPQIMVPWVDYKEILEKKKRYPTSKFLNEVLALPSENSGKLFTPTMIKKCCDENFHQWYEKLQPDMRLERFAGIDVGRAEGNNPSFTVLTIITQVGKGKNKIIYSKKFCFGEETEPLYQIEFIIRKCKEFQVALIGIDWGDSFVFADKILQTFGKKRVLKYYYSGSLIRKIKWEPTAGKFIVNRTTAMSDLRNEFDAGLWVTPKWDFFKNYADDMLAVNVDRYSNDTIKYDHHMSTPDDFYHALVYAHLSKEIFYRNKQNLSF